MTGELKSQAGVISMNAAIQRYGIKEIVATFIICEVVLALDSE
jgi:hypothetical protein